MTWNDLPKELQVSDATMASLSLQDVNDLFELASKYNKLIQSAFAELFWEAMNRVRCNANGVSVQRCVEFLEERKRSIGRTYNIAKKRYPNGWLTSYQAFRYNECEYNIRWLVEQYNCTRKTKPYLLEV